MEGSENNPTPVENAAGETPSVEQYNELIAKVERMESTNQRLLDESKDWKSKYQGMKSSQEEQERKRLEKNDDFKSLLEKEQEAKASLVKRLNSTEEKLFEKSINFEVRNLVPNAHDVNDIVSNLKFGQDDIDMENFTVKNLAERIDDVIKSKPYLVKQSAPRMTNEMPGYNKDTPIGEISTADLRDMYKKNKQNIN